LPLSWLDGLCCAREFPIAGKLFRPVGLAVITSILARCSIDVLVAGGFKLPSLLRSRAGSRPRLRLRTVD
jgi:hypothetical protein